MFRFLHSLLKYKGIKSAQLKDLPSFESAIRLLEKNAKGENKRKVAEFIENYQSVDVKGDNLLTLQHLDQLFEIFIPVLRSSATDSRLAKVWATSVRELLIKVPYTGDMLETAKSIKEDLDNNNDLCNCTTRTKALLLTYADNAQDDLQQVQSFLKNISDKLQSIYSEINETKDSCAHTKESKNYVRNSLSKGMRELKNTIDANTDIDVLKEKLDQLVDALHEKVEKEFDKEESGTLILEQKIAGLSNKVKSLEDHAQDLQETIRKKHEEAITDPLTGLYNRAAYIQALEKAWSRWQEDGIAATLLVWDIDHFKMLNDRYGHAAGDKVLQSVAHKLKSNIEKSDVVARFGGEEFVMLLNNKSIADGERLAESIRSVIATTEFTYKKQPLQVTISCGIAEFVKKDTPTTIFERADKALYKAKRTGRNKVEVLTSAA